jgi:hypothetical protein
MVEVGNPPESLRAWHAVMTQWRGEGSASLMTTTTTCRSDGSSGKQRENRRALPTLLLPRTRSGSARTCAIRSIGPCRKSLARLGQGQRSGLLDLSRSGQYH